MKSTITVQPDNIIYTVLMETTEKEISEWASNLYATVKKQFDNTGPVKIVTDLTNISFVDSFKIRSTISDMEKKNAPYVLKSAAFTPDIKIIWLSNIIARMSGRKNFAAFKKKEKAILWLQTPDKNHVLKETFYLTYNYLKENPNTDEIDLLNYVRKQKNYANNEGEVAIDFFNLQQGTVYVTFHYLKENPAKGREECFRDIEKNYTDLLNKYYLLEA